jgi:hypothetical protein
MNKEFLKLQKIAGLITESEYKEKTDEVVGPWSTNKNSGDDIHNDNADEDYDYIDEENATINQGIYMDFLQDLFDALGSNNTPYNDEEQTPKEKALVNAIGKALRDAGITTI